jgi:hypothetical protein
MFNKGQFTHICQLWPRFRVRNSTQKEIAQELGQYRFNLK